MVECYHYLVLLVSKIFHPEEACFFFFYCVGGGVVVVWWCGGGGGRIYLLVLWTMLGPFFFNFLVLKSVWHKGGTILKLVFTLLRQYLSF